jgi:hypothetical protein
MKSLLFIFSLSLALAGCPDNAANKTTSGGETAGGDEGGATPGGMSGGGMITGGTMSGSSCFDDLECPDDQYCMIDIEVNFGEGSCEEGCRDDDSCDGGRLCDQESRECYLPPCEDDSTCPSNTYCNDDGACEDGCRVGEACADEFDEDGRVLLCDETSRTCVAHSPCCIADEGADRCETSTAEQCDAAGGQLLVSALTCDENPCSDTCELDADCRSLDVNGATFYCDSEDLRCREGCRVDECSGDLICDEVRRICTEQTCVTREDCNEGQYCDPINLVCVSGCNVADDCDAGFTCNEGQCIESCEPGSDVCGDGRYCDANALVCRDECAQHADCLENEACDSSSAQCVAGTCRDDESLGELTGEPNNLPDEASSLTLIPLPTEPEKNIARAEGRVICGGDPDYYNLRLNQGERMRITLDHDVTGNLSLVLSDEDDPSAVLASAAGAQSPKVIEFPEEGEVREPKEYFIRIDGDLEDGVSVGYDLVIQTAPLGDACFSDQRELEAGDNDSDTATALIADGTTSYSDGSICAGDEDWFSIPLTINDGLTVEVSTPIILSELRVDFYRQNTLGGIAGNPNPEFSITSEDSVEDPITGKRVYSFARAGNTASFEEDLYFVVVRGETATDVSSYAIEVTHDASGEICMNDENEPNDGVNQGVDIVSAYDFPTDDEGLLAQGRDNRISDGVICSGDTDYYCFDTAEGDLIEAWAISANAIGNFAVRVIDSDGGAVGVEARQTAQGEDPEYASLIGTSAARYCIVVDGLANAQGDYVLNIRRAVPEGGVCALDESMGRDDIADDAQALVDISDDQGYRFEKRNGLMCNGSVDTADWYTFTVTEDESRICATLEGFQNDTADLDFELYRAPSTLTSACTTDLECEDEGSNACIDGHCQIDFARSTYNLDFELLGKLGADRIGVSAGTHYLRILRGGIGDVSPYDLRVTVTPNRETCEPDWQEVGDPNDSAGLNVQENSRATVLGSGGVGFCDAWLCAGEGDEDWYKVTVPAEEDRTVIIEFSRGDGDLELYYWGEMDTSMGDPDLAVSAVPGDTQNYQCLNIRGGASDIDVELGVAGLAASFMGERRIDYNFRVIPTDLDTNPDGACALFDRGVTPRCDTFPDFGFAETCWAEVTLP